MKRVASPLLIVFAAALFISLTTPVNARTTPKSPSKMSTDVVFRLHVAGTVPQDMTFWMAYGPLADRFGIVQLHRAGQGVYTAVTHLPVGKSTFAYIAGHGVISTRLGPAPGGPIVTIRRLFGVTARQAGLTTVRWRASVG